jgi:hypothetical protein
MRQSGRDPAPTPPRTQTRGVRATGPGRPTPTPLSLANAWGVHATNRPRPLHRHPLALKRGVCVQQRPAAITHVPSHANVGCVQQRPAAAPHRHHPRRPLARKPGECVQQRLPATPPRHPLACKRVGGVCDILCIIFLLDSYLVSVVYNVSGHLNHLIVIDFFSTYTSMSDGFGPACHLRTPQANQSRGRVGPLTALTK